MIHNQKDMENPVYEKVKGRSKKLLVINSLFTCMCEQTGLCFRHGVNRKNPSFDESKEEK